MVETSQRRPDETDVILRDGGTLRLRPPNADDRDAVGAFYAALSDQSRYLGVHGYGTAPV